MKTKKIIGMSIAAILSFATFLEAGKISLETGDPLADQASPSHSSGFGGWNLDNVNVKITDLDYVEIEKTFTESDGSYSTMVMGDTFESDILDTTTDNKSDVLVNLHGKDWPVGEPSGIKVMESTNFNDVLTHSKPASCIMTNSFLAGAYLDAETPSETLCDSDFQTHKRFKLNLLSTMYDATTYEEGIASYGKGVNLTFNVKDDDNTWRYMVLQKINNYTDKRMDGYKMEIGFLDDTGAFTPASKATNPLSETLGSDIRLSIGTNENIGKDGTLSNIWDADELATFSNGLFGASDSHFDTNGFFDSTRAGYNIGLNGAKDTIESSTSLGSNYSTLFGNWVPSIWAPSGIFWDDDNDPETDAEVVAFWADYDKNDTYEWTKGNEDKFIIATPTELLKWASSSAYSVDVIEDVLNLGLSYIVEIGNISTFPTYSSTSDTGTFTIRITPKFAATQVAPGYVANEAPELSTYITSEGLLSITPAPSFTIGNTLTLVVADEDLISNDWVTVKVTTSLGESETIELEELDPTRGVFTLELPTVSGSIVGTDNDGTIVVKEGTIVTATYTDEDDGSGGINLLVTASTTATITPVTTTTTSDGGSSGAVNDNISLIFTIFGFLLIGGLIARRKLA